MDIIDVTRLRGTPPGVVGACSGHPVRLLSRRLLPGCPRAVLLSTGRGVLYLAREGPTARFRHDGGTNVEDSGCTSLRVHLGPLLASGPALALALHLPVKCGSRTPGPEFRCRIVSREEGYCVSWVPLGVERVACMTAACLKTLALICLTKLVW